MQTIIRQYAADDLDDLLFAWESASKIGHPFLTADFLEQEQHNIAHVYLPVADTWVAEQGQKVIGFISLIGNEVGALFVQPQFHGTGVGRALMEKARELQGDLEVEVFKANAIGRNFYKKAGFEPLSEKMHEPTGHEMLRLKLSANNLRITDNSPHSGKTP